MNKEQFIAETKKLGINLTEEQLNKLDQFYNLLIEWNEKINLTRITKKEDVYLKHFYDSLTLAKVIDLSTKETLCDVGTGAGFPGIVLKIVYPNFDEMMTSNLTTYTYMNLMINSNFSSSFSNAISSSISSAYSSGSGGGGGFSGGGGGGRRPEAAVAGR